MLGTTSFSPTIPTCPISAGPPKTSPALTVNYGSASGGGFPGGNAGGDWFHCNALDYDPMRDHLMLNSRNWCEFYIIDHGTTTCGS